jgi:formylglycine-generating enzyme required for sulfatase activity
MATVRQVRFPGGTLRLAPSDWEAQGVVTTKELHVGAFALDSTEVTYERWQRCVDAGGCRRLSWQEPGRPVVNVAPKEAQTFCRFVGGRLPTAPEWLFAATGTDVRRYPWGNTGLVCRRAAFGLVSGPCSEGARGPELAGFRPDGASAEEVHDLSGNVAEWTAEPEGGYSARGGSYLSQVAAELKTWASEPNHGPAPHIGFRCAYDESH